MRQHRFEHVSSPEDLFLIGGKGEEVFYAQPGLNPEHDSRYLVAYGRGEAAVDSIIDSGGDPADQKARAAAISRITERVPSALEIEQARQSVADSLSQR